MKEVLKEVEYGKIQPIIEYLSEHDEINTKTAKNLTGKSSSTVWRYLNKLCEVGVLTQTGKQTRPSINVVSLPINN